MPPDARLVEASPRGLYCQRAEKRVRYSKERDLRYITFEIKKWEGG